jgi:uncharacterized protein
MVRLTIKALQRIALRPRTPLDGCVAPNGCCVPLLKKMHVRVSGDVYLCEQFPHANCVGNVNTGFDLAKAAQLALDYSERSLPQCQHCWAVRLCGSCYQQAMRDCRWDGELRRAECRKQRQTVIQSLAHYAELLEQDPRAFDGLENVQFIAPI